MMKGNRKFSAVKAGMVYFLLAFAAGFALGTIRTLVLNPAFGKVVAVGLEIPIMLVFCWIVCDQVIRRSHDLGFEIDRIVMGLTAFTLLICAELVLSVVAFGRQPIEYFHSFLSLEGAMGLAAQTTFGLFPLLHLQRLANRKHNVERD